MCEGGKTGSGCAWGDLGPQSPWAQPRWQWGGRGDGKDSLAVAAALPRCACACMCTCVCVCTWVCTVPASVHQGGASPLRGGTLCCVPLGLSLQRKFGQPPPGCRALRLQSVAFQPTPGAECGAGGGRVGCQAHFSIGDPLHVPLLPPGSHGCWCVFPSPSHTSLGSRYTLLTHFGPPPFPHNLPHLPALRCHERPGLSPTSFPGGSGVLCLMLGHVGTGRSGR